MTSGRFFLQLSLALVISSATTAWACGTYPAGVTATDLVLDFLPNSGKLKKGTKAAVGTPQEGTVVYDASVNSLKLCDGTTWQTITLGPTPTSTNVAAVWGQSTSKQLGNSAISTSTSVPIRLDSVSFGSYQWKKVTRAGSHACGIRASDDTMYCWGLNSGGQLAQNDSANPNSSSYPLPLTTVGGFKTTPWKTVVTPNMGGHTCAIRASDDAIFCWGGNSAGQNGDGTTVQKNLPTALAGGFNSFAWESVALGNSHTCAISLPDRYIYCWGSNANGQLGNGVSTGSYSLPAPLTSTGGWDTTKWKAVGAGANHTCGIRDDDLIYCWGGATQGAMGSSTNSPVPVPLTTTGSFNTTKWKALAVASTSTCAIRQSDDTLFCWGSNDHGQAGMGATAPTAIFTPTALSATGNWNTFKWSQVFISGQTTCATSLADSRLYCWGRNTYGALGDGTTNSSSVPRPLSSTDSWDSTAFSDVALSTYATCAIRTSDKKMFCWGNSILGSLETNKVLPISLIDNKWDQTSWDMVSTSLDHSCGIRSSDKKIFCWGLTSSGQIGNGTTQSVMWPTGLSATGGWDSMQWKMVSAGDSHTCGIRSDNLIFCWGANGAGQLGTGTGVSTLEPIALTATDGWNATEWKYVSAGKSNTCAIRASDDRLFCWGLNTYGALGNNTNTSSPVPTPLTSTGGWDAMMWKTVVIRDHVCAIRSDDLMFCWGYNLYGQLGFGNSGAGSDSWVPRPLSSTNNFNTMTWKTVAVGGNSTCGLTRDTGLIYCWGNNISGMLGTGDSSPKSVPTALASAGGWSTTVWKSVNTGPNHTCAVRSSDGQAFCWGNGSSGILGTGNSSNSNVPVSLSSSGVWNTRSWVTVIPGSYHTLALESDINDCSIYTASFNSNDYAMQFAASSGKTKDGPQSRMGLPSTGVLALDRYYFVPKLCIAGRWTPISSLQAGLCSTYPAGTNANQRVIEWVADGANKTYNSNTTLRATPRAGSMIYNSTLKKLQVCDGSNWKTLGTGP